MTTPQGRGSVSGFHQLPPRLRDTLTSSLVDTGKVHLHAVVGDDGAGGS